MTAPVRTTDTQGARRVDVAVLLTRWRSGELAYAGTFDQCAGASFTEIEDLYDATATTLLEQEKPFGSEEHLRRALRRGIRLRALRRGIRLRALRLHRDHRVRKHLLDQAAPGMIAERERQAWREEPEQALLAREDDLIVGEFLAELTPLERSVFALVAEGRSWRAIATALELSKNEARNATRACERKREHFATLYSTGRLCGYRLTHDRLTTLREGAQRAGRRSSVRAPTTLPQVPSASQDRCRRSACRFRCSRALSAPTARLCRLAILADRLIADCSVAGCSLLSPCSDTANWDP